MTAAERVVAAARAAVGTRFRLHGRDAGGLDCVGLALVALRAGGMRGEPPCGYALRSSDAARVMREAGRLGLVRACTRQPGDLMLLACPPGQLHLAIATADGMVHACTMLRRVVERPGPSPWPLVACWRIGES